MPDLYSQITPDRRLVQSRL